MTPNGWKELKLGDVVSFEYGKSLPSAQRRGGPVPVCGSNGVVGYHDESLVRGPGIVVGRKGSVGAIAWMGCDFWPIDTTYYVNPTSQTEPRWLYYAISNLRLERLNEATGIPGLNRSTATSLHFQVPPIVEQRKIAAILFSVEDAIEKTQAVIDQVQVIKRGLLQELLTRGWPEEHTRFKKTPIGEIPENWDYAPLGTRTELQPGFAFKSQDFSPDGDRLLRGSNVAVGRLTWPDDKTKYFPRERRGEVSEYVLQKDDIIVAMDRPFIAGGFKIARVTASDLPALLLQRVGRFHRHRELTPGYLWQLLQSPYVETHLQITQKGTDLPHISKSEIEASICPFPPVEEQEQIASCLATLDEYATRLSEQQQRAQQLKTGLMSVLLTGELRVTPDPEPA